MDDKERLVNPFDQQPPFVPPPVSPQSPYQYQPQSQRPGSSGMKKLVITLVLLFVALPIIVSVGFGVWIGLSAPNSKIYEDKAEDTLDKVNSVIASWEYFNWDFPAISCGPSDATYSIDKQQWLTDWAGCLNKSWDTVQGFAKLDENNKEQHLGAPPVKIISSAAEVTSEKCKPTAEAENTGGFFCPSDDTIYMMQDHLTTPTHDLGVLFHEYAHVLQVYAFHMDAQITLNVLYLDYPSQPISKDEAVELYGSRMEINAECSMLGMMQTSGRLGGSDGLVWLESFKNPEDFQIERGYGSKVLREQMATQIVGQSNPTMQACNSFKWSDATIKSQ